MVKEIKLEELLKLKVNVLLSSSSFTFNGYLQQQSAENLETHNMPNQIYLKTCFKPALNEIFICCGQALQKSAKPV